MRLIDIDRLFETWLIGVGAWIAGSFYEAGLGQRALYAAYIWLIAYVVWTLIEFVKKGYRGRGNR